MLVLIVCLFIAHINYFCTRFEVHVSLTEVSSLLGCHIKSLGKCFPYLKESWCFHLKDPAVEEEESTWDKSGCYIYDSVAYQTATSSFIIRQPTKSLIMPTLPCQVCHTTPLIVSPPIPTVCYP